MHFKWGIYEKNKIIFEFLSIISIVNNLVSIDFNIQQGQNGINSANFSPDGKYIISAGWFLNFFKL